MQRYDQRRCYAIDQVQHHVAMVAAENAVFVLQPHRIDRVFVDDARGCAIVFSLARPNDRTRFGIAVRIVSTVDDMEVDGKLGMIGTDLFVDVGGECRDAALAWSKTTDQGHTAPGPQRRAFAHEQFDNFARIGQLTLLVSGRGFVQWHRKHPISAYCNKIKTRLAGFSFAAMQHKQTIA